MEDPPLAIEDPTAVDRAAVVAANRAVNPTPLVFSCEFSVEYGLG